ncbi:MAG: glycosyltransferase family 2 protein, partial [Propionibacteriaceae bacterium]|nr:glycosyltransferase family 2 protein [Propionibacteriaceae bacterium]
KRPLAHDRRRSRIPRRVTVHHDVAALVVTYFPGDLGPLLDTLASQCGTVLVVDNTDDRERAADVSEACERAGARVISLGENLGIAAAQNAGIDDLLGVRPGTGGSGTDSKPISAILLCDHDSLPSSTMVADLLPHLGPGVAAVGPVPREDRLGGDELVYVARTWGPRRASPEDLRAEFIDAAFLIASGCLISREALLDIGPMNDSWFIDHVDLEWGLRARLAGWRLLAIPGAGLTHSLGDNVVLLPGRDQPVHVHAPIRTYYLTRNTLRLVSSGLLPRRWVLGYLVWLGKYVAFNAVAAQPRQTRMRYMAWGLRDGIRGRLGRLGRQL